MIKINQLKKSYGSREVLRGIDLIVENREAIALIGPSGSGKTTLIRTINGFVVPDEGQVFIDNVLLDTSNSENLRQTRKKIGMIYQLFNLVERTSVLHNVLSGALGFMDSGISLLLSSLGMFQKEYNEKAFEILHYVGMADRAYDRVDRLSGGQKQRVAIARALMQNPEILLADEPIANLDPKASLMILDLLNRIQRDKGIIVLTVLHDVVKVKDYFNRVVAIQNGAIVYDGLTKNLNENELSYIYEFEQSEELVSL